MDTRHLEAFRTVMETGSMTAAASLLGKSQPAVSSLISRLEDELGLALFKRGKGRLEATPEAHFFYEEARRALSAFDRAAQVARDLKPLRLGTLALASQPGLATYVLPPIIAKLLDRWPSGTVQFITRSSSMVRDLGQIEAFDIFEIPCVCVLPAGHPLARQPVLTPAMLDDVPFISLYSGHYLHEALESAFAESSARLKVVTHVEFFGTACALVAENLGVTLVDIFTGTHFEKTGLVTRPFRPDLLYRFAMFQPNKRPLSRIAMDFVDRIRSLSTTRTSDLSANVVPQPRVLKKGM